MTQTYWQLKEKIAALELQAEELKNSELAEVIAKTRATIATYGLTEKDLFGGKAPKAAKAPRTAAKPAATAKYTDGTGNVWGGRGPRPQWLRTALQAGAKLSDLLAGRAPAGDTAPAAPAVQPDGPKVKVKAKRKGAKAAAAKPAVKQKVAAKYRDAAGNTWSGRGLQPRWLKAALADGKRIEDFAI